jgi:hypothetical protein
MSLNEDEKENFTNLVQHFCEKIFPNMSEDFLKNMNIEEDDDSDDDESEEEEEEEEEEERDIAEFNIKCTFCKNKIENNEYVITPCSHFLHTLCIRNKILGVSEEKQDLDKLLDDVAEEFFEKDECDTCQTEGECCTKDEDEDEDEDDEDEDDDEDDDDDDDDDEDDDDDDDDEDEDEDDEEDEDEDDEDDDDEDDDEDEDDDDDKCEDCDVCNNLF